MKRNDAEQIGKLIQQYLRQESLESPLNEQRLLDAWPQVLGPAASYTSNLYIRNQTLYVHLTSAALRQELMMGRELLVRTLNQRGRKRAVYPNGLPGYWFVRRVEKSQGLYRETVDPRRCKTQLVLWQEVPVR